MRDIKAVIFDWGGVLIDDPAPALIANCSAALGVTEEAFAAAQAKYLPLFDSGQVDEVAFWQQMTADLQVPQPHPPTLWGDVFRKIYSPRPQVFAWVAELQQKGYITGLLSNTEPPMQAFFLRQGYDMFDITLFSCAEKTRKPEAKIFELLLRKAGLPASSVLYLDDKEHYGEAARRCGLESRSVDSVEKVQQVLLDYSLPISPYAT